MSSAPSHPALSFDVRTECPPGACTCEREALLALGADRGDWRVLQLTQAEEKKLLYRLEHLETLQDLYRMQARMRELLGIQVQISVSPNEVRTLRGLVILVQEQPGLCRKTRKAIPAAIRKSLEQRPQIVFDLLDAQGLFGADATR